MVQLNLNHFFTFPGYLKLIEGVVTVISMICFGSYGGYYGDAFLWFTTITCLIVISVMGFAYLFAVVDALPIVPWVFVELVYSAFYTLFYFISMCLAISISSMSWSKRGPYGAAVFFFIVVMLAFFLNTLVFFRKWREGERHLGTEGSLPGPFANPPSNTYQSG